MRNNPFGHKGELDGHFSGRWFSTNEKNDVGLVVSSDAASFTQDILQSQAAVYPPRSTSNGTDASKRISSGQSSAMSARILICNVLLHPLAPSLQHFPTFFALFASL